MKIQGGAIAAPFADAHVNNHLQTIFQTFIVGIKVKYSIFYNAEDNDLHWSMIFHAWSSKKYFTAKLKKYGPHSQSYFTCKSARSLSEPVIGSFVNFLSSEGKDNKRVRIVVRACGEIKCRPLVELVLRRGRGSWPA